MYYKVNPAGSSMFLGQDRKSGRFLSFLKLVRPFK